MRRMPTLHLDKVRETIATLRLRVEERFPGSGLAGIVAELERTAAEVPRQVRAMHRPIWWVWALVAFTILVLGSVMVLLASSVRVQGTPTWTEMAQGLDAITSELALMIGVVVFLAGWQTRLRRNRVVAAVRRLRELAHIVDMLQLTKDPGGAAGVSLPATAHSPRRDLSPKELERYLDYCAELLSLTAKVAQFYVADFDDADATAAVTDLEDMTNGLSGKIWQKIMIIDRHRHPGR
ncbi:MAG: hypothetical protein RLZZ127_29 [Planctomycetota bacterium]|jgi:hypothetical protein